MVHRRWVPYCHSPLFSDLLHPEDGPSQGPHELPANPIHSSYGRLALGTAFTAGYKLPSARAITRSIAVHGGECQSRPLCIIQVTWEVHMGHCANRCQLRALGRVQ